MKTILLTFFSLSCFFIHGQKIEKKVIDDSTIKSIVIEGDAIFKVKVKAKTTKSIKIDTKIEGEYAKNTFLNSRIENDSLLITTSYHTILEKDNDKLSAHKVTSLEVTLEIPENLTLYFKSEIASAEISGKYKLLILELNQGNAKIIDFVGHAIVNTFNGNIDLETNNAIVSATTKHGEINKEDIVVSENQVRIHSVNGNINITKTK